jgi:histidinol-phosphate aminotransferase
VNVIAGGPPAWLRTAIADALDRIGAYPDEREAVEAAAHRHGRHPDEVVLLNGGAQGFWLVAAAITAREPVVVHPSFTEPEVALRAVGRPPRRVILEPPWRLDPDAVPHDADLVILGNPTNPTGVLHPRAAVAALCRAGRTTVVDEAFMDFVPGEAESVAGERLPGLVVLRSLTKLHAIPGLRAGYLLAAPELAARLRAQRPGWSVNALALAATVACMERPDHVRAIAEATASARGDLAAHLRPHARVHPGVANFLLVEHSTMVERLRCTGIAVRPCASFPGLSERHVRVTVRDPEAHARLARALA